MSKKRRVTKVQLVDEKGATPKTPMLDYVLKLIPLFLFFGAIHQLWALYAVWKLSALAFYSWSQVVNDTVVLLPFAFLVIVSSWMWALFYRDVSQTDFPSWKWLFIFILYPFATPFLCSLVILFAYSEWRLDTFWSSALMSAIYFIITFSFTFWYSALLKKYNQHVWKFIALSMAIVMSWTWLWLTFPMMRGLLKSNWCTWKWDRYTTIEYMNDKYLFSSGAILNDSGTLIWTWMGVYARNDEDKFVRCMPTINTQTGSLK